jgi:hypothetical protein
MYNSVLSLYISLVLSSLSYNLRYHSYHVLKYFAGIRGLRIIGAATGYRHSDIEIVKK